MSFNMDDAMKVLQIVKALKDTELHIDTGEMKLSIFKGEVGDGSGRAMGFSAPVCQAAPAAAPAAAVAEVKEEPKAEAAPACAPVKAAPEEPINEEGLVKISASVTSVFYRRPSPDEPPFVEVGDDVTEDTPLCLLEVMKCFRQVLAGVNGRIEKICVESNHFVEKGDVLFLIQPK
jgi:acetyl-CoA carboxylase biotin carboxyl carrier protein